MTNAGLKDHMVPSVLHGIDENFGRLLIGDQWVRGSGGTLDLMNPATGEYMATISLASPQDVDNAVQCAVSAMVEWQAMTPAAREQLIRRIGDLILEQADELARLESLNTGKPLDQARAFDVAHAAESAHYNAGWATKLNAETRNISRPGRWQSMTIREPVGVVAAIVPWNAPLPMAVNKITAALAAGCTVVLKPSELTPFTAARLGELILEAGVPAGVVNIVPGVGEIAGAALVKHPKIAKVSFTGSTVVGKEIASVCGSAMKRYSLELGGKSPVIIFPDADLRKAIPAAAMGIFANTGQVCAAGSRLFVHDMIHDQVVEGIKQIAEELQLGSGDDPQSDLGPVISSKQRDRVMGYIELGMSEGATLVCGGEQQGPGFFIKPTIFTDTTADMRITREEIFGPVLTVQRFSDEESFEDIVHRANESEYGLSASIWTSDISNALRAAQAIEAGTVRINSAVGIDPNIPFGGVKGSGVGRENGREGIEQFTDLKTIVIDLNN